MPLPVRNTQSKAGKVLFYQETPIVQEALGKRGPAQASGTNLSQGAFFLD
jgi:hypothetical protein